jgi:hypothetical protein
MDGRFGQGRRLIALTVRQVPFDGPIPFDEGTQTLGDDANRRIARVLEHLPRLEYAPEEVLRHFFTR